MNVIALARPTQPICTLAELKRHLGVTSDDKDTDIEALAEAATNYIQRRCGRSFAYTLWRMTLEAGEVPSGTAQKLRLPFPPVVDIELVEYENAAGVTAEMLQWQLACGEDGAEITPAAGAAWPDVQEGNLSALRIEYVAGHEVVPAEARHCVKMLVRHWYDNASAVITGVTSKPIEMGVNSLIRSMGTGFYADL